MRPDDESGVAQKADPAEDGLRNDNIDDRLDKRIGRRGDKCGQHWVDLAPCEIAKVAALSDAPPCGSDAWWRRPSRSTSRVARSASFAMTYQTQFSRRRPTVTAAPSPGMK